MTEVSDLRSGFAVDDSAAWTRRTSARERPSIESEPNSRKDRRETGPGQKLERWCPIAGFLQETCPEEGTIGCGRGLDGWARGDRRFRPSR